MKLRERTTDFDSFARRHIGPSEDEVQDMLREVGFENLDALIDAAVPKNIRLDRQLNLPEAKSEIEALAELRAVAKKNKIARSFIEIFLKIRAGTPLTRLIRQKSHKAGSKRCSISNR